MFYEQSFFDYLSLERRFSPHTLAAYQNDLTQFITYLTAQQCLTSVAEVRHLHIRSWVVSYMQAGQSPRSINRRLSCLKTYFHFLKRRGLVEKDPMPKVVGPKTGRRLPVYVQENQLEHLFEKVDFGAGYEGRRDRLILEILYAAGLRRSELTNLKINDIDLGRCVFRVLGKGGKERIVPFARYLAELLEKYLQARREAYPGTPLPWLLLNKNGDPLSPQSVYHIVRKYLSLVTSAEQRGPHVLRHSFATHLSNHGADLNAIKELLGHANLAATQVYTHNSIEKLKKVYEQAHPKSKEEE